MLEEVQGFPVLPVPEEPPKVLLSRSYPDPSLGFFTNGVTSAQLPGQKGVTGSNRP